MKKFGQTLLVILIMILIVGGCAFTYLYFTGKITLLNENSIEPIFALEEYPKIDGSTATIPLSQAFIQAFTGDESAIVKHNTTHNAYVNLINGDADIILVTYPSEEELQMAEENGVELEITPVVNEGFVFFVNENNPVESLTLDEIESIYAGEITNWKDVGGKNEKIKAFQREPNSGSQSGMIDLVMKNKKLMEAPKEDIVEGMEAIVNLVSDYDNGENSLGYSYYYYATTMYDDIDSSVTDRIKFIGVNGVKPTLETIQDGTYPIRTAYYIVTNKNANENTKKLVDAMLSDWGQNVAKEAGYVSLR